MAGSAGDKKSHDRNNRGHRRRREQRNEENAANSSDEENVAPRASLREELRRIQRQMDAFEREFAEANEQARTGTDEMIEKFKEIMEPETDYDSDALMFSETESESSESDSSIFSDSSDSSSEEEGDEAGREECKGEEQKTMTNKVYDDSDYGELQRRMDQIYFTKPVMPESELSPGLLCVTNWQDRWMRVLVQSYDPTTAMVNVGALDYGVHFEVHKSDIKPLVNDSQIVSIPYRFVKEKNSQENKPESGGHKHKGTEELDDEAPLKKLKENTNSSEEKPSSAAKINAVADQDGGKPSEIKSENSDPVSSISSTEKDDITTGEKDLKQNENKLPVPSTSAQSWADFDAENEASKIYKKSFAFLQFQWCKQQPDFIKLRQELSEKHNPLSSEGADVYAFLEYTEKIEQEENNLREAKINSLKEKVERKKQKIKAKYKKRYRKEIEKLKNKQWEDTKKMDIKRERELRKTYLQGEEDIKFKKE